MSINVVGIAGVKGSGKSTLCRGLIGQFGGPERCIRIGFADEIKELAHRWYDVPHSVLHGTDSEKQAYTVEVAGQPVTVRKLLQTLGTEVGRHVDPYIWVNLGMRKCFDWLKLGAGLVIFDDVRFQNEVDAIRGAGGIVVGLERGLAESADQHASESGIQYLEGVFWVPDRDELTTLCFTTSMLDSLNDCE